jgi:hypothetical protein
MNNNIGGFVFVVCGAKEHLDTLSFSYSVLQAKTTHPIYVVTDNSRNEYLLQYPNLVDVRTPGHYNHHEASIWLKTSLHLLLPAHKIYAYLDTDVLAYSKNPDGIFKEYMDPIRFAPDHCKMPNFSPYAVNCGCMDLFENKRKEVDQLLKELDPLSGSPDPIVIAAREKLFKVFQQSKTRGKLPVGFYIRYFLSWPYFNINEEFRLDRRKKMWIDKKNNAVMHKVNMRKVAKQSGLKWNYLHNEMALPDGRNLWSNYCSHLPELIRKKFNVNITNAQWQHWNGGVFLFGPASKDFMDTWHQYTLEIFADPEWKTRDQGILIATVWKLGLEDHPTLDQKWNLILDYYYPNIRVLDNGEITLDGKKIIQPEFVHIYHHWGDTKWEVWNKVMDHIK